MLVGIKISPAFSSRPMSVMPDGGVFSRHLGSHVSEAVSASQRVLTPARARARACHAAACALPRGEGVEVVLEAYTAYC